MVSKRNTEKPYDEWGRIVQMQVEAANEIDRKQRELGKEAKNCYIEELGTQVAEKQTILNEGKRMKKEEVNLNKAREQQVVAWEMNRTEQEGLEKRRAREDCTQEINGRKEANHNARTLELTEGRKLIANVKKAILRGEHRQIIEKQEQIENGKKLLLEQERKQMEKTQFNQLDKLHEQRIVAENLRRSLERDNLLAQGKQSKLDNIERKLKAFDPVIQDRAHRESHRSGLVTTWTAEHSARLEQKHVLEQQIKSHQVSSTQKFNTNLISVNEHRRELQKRSLFLDKAESDRKNLILKQQEQLETLQKRSAQTNYNLDLFKQSCAKQEETRNALRLTDNERKYHFGGYRSAKTLRETEFPSIPGMTSRYPVFHRTKTTLSSFLTPRSPTTHLSASPTKHDPITNPLGGYSPRVTSFAKGRGLASLYS